VAHEITTLIPTYGKSTCQQFFTANGWVKEFLPNADEIDCGSVVEGRVRWLKLIGEKLLDNRFGSYLDTKLKELTKHYWSKKFKKNQELDMTEIAQFEDHLSTHHPNNFKHIILNRSQQILNRLEKEFSITLSK
jgi:hypothetical protein